MIAPRVVIGIVSAVEIDPISAVLVGLVDAAYLLLGFAMSLRMIAMRLIRFGERHGRRREQGQCERNSRNSFQELLHTASHLVELPTGRYHRLLVRLHAIESYVLLGLCPSFRGSAPEGRVPALTGRGPCRGVRLHR